MLGAPVALLGTAIHELAVEVLDEGVAAPTRRRGGRGLAGMYERVALYGGMLEVGPHADGGFCVSVRFPLATP